MNILELSSDPLPTTLAVNYCQDVYPGLERNLCRGLYVHVGVLTPGLCVCMTTWRLTANGKLPYNNLLPCRVFNWIEHRLFAGDWVSVKVPPSLRCYLKEAECQRGAKLQKARGCVRRRFEKTGKFFFFLAKFNGLL